MTSFLIFFLLFLSHLPFSCSISQMFRFFRFDLQKNVKPWIESAVMFGGHSHGFVFVFVFSHWKKKPTYCQILQIYTHVGAGGHSHSHSHSFPQPFKGAGEVRGIPRLVGLVGPDALLVIAATVALLVSAGINLALPYAIGLLIDSPDKDRNLENGLRLLWILCIVFVTGAFFTMIRGYLFSLAGERVVRRIRTQLFNAILRQDVAFFGSNNKQKSN